MEAVSADGACRFDGSRLHADGEVVDVFEIDFFDRWTFARFLPTGELALAFESGQPWFEGGSYGDRYGGIQILARNPDRWALVAFEFDYRAYDRTFVPLDVAYHRRGLLAFLHDGVLSIQLLAEPRTEVDTHLGPYRDSDLELAASHDLCGSWTELAVDPKGTLLTARGPEGVEFIDLEYSRRARQGEPWEPLR